MKSALILAALSASARAYWLMGVGTLFESPQRLDPIVTPEGVASHAHKILGASNFGPTIDSATLRDSECTTTPIKEDKSSYWVPNFYFEWANGSVSYVDGGAVIYYLFPDEAGKTTPFPDDFRMISGDPYLRSYDSSSFAQQAISYLCLDYRAGHSTSRHTGIPTDIECPDGIRAQINFPSCWNGKDTDSPDHKSHVAFRSGGPDSGDCQDSKYPFSLPRIFIEIYWGTQDFKDHYAQAKNPKQPFVLANGDSTGYGYHGDFFNGWHTPTLQKAVDQCHCNIYGDPQCCADAGIFTLDNDSTGKCKKTNMVAERTVGMLSKLPGNNPISGSGGRATPAASNADPGFLSPVIVYTDGKVPDANYETIDAAASASTPASEPSSTTGQAANTTGVKTGVFVAEPSSEVEDAATTKESKPTTKATGATTTAVNTAPEATSPAQSNSDSDSDDESDDTQCSNDTQHGHGHHRHHHKQYRHQRREARSLRSHRSRLDYEANTF